MLPGTNCEDGDAGQDGFFTLSIAGVDGTETVAVILNKCADQSPKATGADRDITVSTSIASGTSGSQIAEMVLQAPKW